MATSIENFDGRHEHPSLCAINYKSYSNDNEKKKAADDITEKMAISVEAVYKKITSLRTQCLDEPRRSAVVQRLIVRKKLMGRN